MRDTINAITLMFAVVVMLAKHPGSAAGFIARMGGFVGLIGALSAMGH